MSLRNRNPGSSTATRTRTPSTRGGPWRVDTTTAIVTTTLRARPRDDILSRRTVPRIPGGEQSLSVLLFLRDRYVWQDRGENRVRARFRRQVAVYTRLARETRLTRTAAAESGERIHGGGGGASSGTAAGRGVSVVGRTAAAALFDTILLHITITMMWVIALRYNKIYCSRYECYNT